MATTAPATTPRPKVLLLGTIEHAHPAWSEIASLADIITPPPTQTRPSFLAACTTPLFAGITAAYRTFESVSTTGPLDAPLIAALPASLRFICHNGAGYDQIDVAACTARGIRVSHAPNAVDDATADLALFLLLGALRGLGPGMDSARAGRWRGEGGYVTLPLGRDPGGKVLGILGMGGIGRNLARKARALGMRIRYCNRTRLAEDVEREVGAEFVGFDDLLAGSDVLSLNLPLNPSTRHILSTAEFAKMQRGVVIVNTARGAVIDEAALVDALESGQVAGVGLDVYEKEPEIHPGLMSNPRALLVPHMGTYTEETQTKMEEWTISNLRMAITEGRLRSIVPEQKDLEWT